MQPVLLVRPDFMTKYETRFAEAHFPIVTSRTACRDALVLGRYSVLPFYAEVERDLAVHRCRLVNTLEQHQWIADFRYYRALKHLTPETWDESDIHLCDHDGPFIVKGATTSKKRQWNRSMFAETKRQAFAIAEELREDTWIGDQRMLFRKYVPLRTFALGKNGLPFTNEWRFFFYGETRLSYGYYWSISDCVPKAEMTPEGLSLADRVAEIAARHVRFFTVDIAETEEGGWILIELNEGQMATLCENDPEELYRNLRDALRGAVRDEPHHG